MTIGYTADSSILIVDDDELVAQRLQETLAGLGLDSMVLSSLGEARAAMRAVYFPLVILDRHLGEADSIELCREYRARQSGNRVLILIWSADDAKTAVQSVLAAGADEFISKHAGEAELIATIKRLYEVARERTQPEPRAPESSRLNALRSTGVLDTQSERAYDDIVRLASTICNTPMALVSLVDEERRWFKAKADVDACSTPPEHAFCAHAIEGDGVFVVEDARQDHRFAASPLVVGEPHIRFFAGAPLITEDGKALGTLCVIDVKPRTLTDEQCLALTALSRQVVLLIKQRKDRLKLERTLAARRASDGDLRRSEELFRAAFESAPLGMALVSTRGAWLRVNRRLCDMLGYSADALLSTDFQALTHADDLAADLANVKDVLAGNIDGYEMDKRYLHKNGRVIHGHLKVQLIRDEQGSPAHFLVHIQDMTGSGK